MSQSLVRSFSSRVAWRAAVAIGVLTMAVAGCSSSGNSGSGSLAAADDNHTITVVLPSEPPYLEPCNTNSDTDAWVLRGNITQTLAVQDPTTHRVQGVLATGWKQLNPSTWQFTLRSGVKFQNGAPFGAADVVHTIQRFQNAKLACFSQEQFFSNEKLTATAVNNSTVDITTSLPDPILPEHTAFIDIVPRATPDTEDNAPIGTGPYKFVSWQRGTSITLQRWSGYWGPKPQIAGVKYEWRDDPTVAAGMVANGEADFAFNLSPNSGAGSTAKTYAQSSVTWLRMQADRPPLNSPLVRDAIRYATNADALIKSVFDGYGKPASQLITSSVDGYDPNIQPWPYNPTKAKQLIAQAKQQGVNTSALITLIGRTDLYAGTTQFMEAVQQMLSDVGLNVKLDMLTHEAYLKYSVKPYPTNIGAYIIQALHGNQCGDPSCSLPQFYSQDGISSNSGTPQLDAMIAKAESASGAQRTADWQATMNYIGNVQGRDVYIAQTEAIVAVGPHISYTPSAETDLALPISQISFKG